MQDGQRESIITEPDAQYDIYERAISPKNLVPLWYRESSDAESLIHPLPFTPAKRIKGRRNFCPKIQGLTAATVEALLPGSAFGHARLILRRGYWSVKDERELRQSWSSEDECELEDTGTSRYEIGVWAVMAEHYRCTPRDLFRYGLRWEPPDNVANSLFHEALRRLLPHPFFRGDVALLRAALQLAVMNRVGENNHVHMLGPGWSHKDPSFVAWLDETPPKERDKYWQKDRARTAEMRFMAQVLRQLCREIDTDPYGCRRDRGDLHGWLVIFYRDQLAAMGRTAPKLGDWTEGLLFLLQVVDLEALEWAIDRCYSSSMSLAESQGHGVQAYFQSYWARMASESSGDTNTDNYTVGQLDSDEVKMQKRLAVLAERREALIRIRMHKAKESYRLLDIPPFDPDPGFDLWDECRRGHNKYDPGPLLALQYTSLLLASTRDWLLRSEDSETQAFVTKELVATERTSQSRRPIVRIPFARDVIIPNGPPDSSSTTYSRSPTWRSWLEDSLSPTTHLAWIAFQKRPFDQLWNHYASRLGEATLRKLWARRVARINPLAAELENKLHAVPSLQNYAWPGQAAAHGAAVADAAYPSDMGYLYSSSADEPMSGRHDRPQSSSSSTDSGLQLGVAERAPTSLGVEPGLETSPGQEGLPDVSGDWANKTDRPADKPPPLRERRQPSVAPLKVSV